MNALDEYGRKRILQVIATLVIAVAMLFVFAGKITYIWGWVYLAVGMLSVILGGAYVIKRNPDAINERGRPAEEQKSWDKALLAFYFPLFVSVYIVCGLDARFGWSEMPLWLNILGVLLTLASSALTYSAMAHNKFLSMVVQVAQQRDHQVATSGPYRFVRHPMYLSVVLSWPALALLLGSSWGLVPGLLAASLIVLRTHLEDRMLQAELAGYAEYARQVRYRLLPGVW